MIDITNKKPDKVCPHCGKFWKIAENNHNGQLWLEYIVHRPSGAVCVVAEQQVPDPHSPPAPKVAAVS